MLHQETSPKGRFFDIIIVMDISYINEQPSQAEVIQGLVKPKNLLEKISFIILLITIVLSPLVFLTTNYAPIDTAKNLIIAFGVLISAILYVISSVRAKSFTIPKNSVVISGLVIVLTILISALSSDSIQKSIIGQGFEFGTASFLCLMFVASLLISKLVTKNKERLMHVYGALVVSFIILAIFQIIRLVVDPSFLNFGVLASATSTLIGKWSDFGIFAGIIFLMSFFSLRLLRAQRNIKILLWILLVLSGFIVALVNSVLIWTALGVMILVYGIYHVVVSAHKTKISFLTLILFLVCVVFAWVGTDIIRPLGVQVNIDSTELSLPWQLTLDVTSDTIKEKPLFGAGSNRFTNEYLLHKPQMINSSDFWNLEFTNGFGFIPTFLVTGGLVGFLAWILFLIFFIKAGVRLIKKEHHESTTRFASVSTFLISAFLWLVSIAYTPSHVILFFTFVFTGLFIVSIASEKHFRINSKKVATIVSLIVLIILIFWTLAYLKKTVSLSYFKGGIGLLSSQDRSIEKAEAKFKSALSWDTSDIYYQALAEIDMMKIQALGQQLQQQAQKDQKPVDQNSLNTLNSLLEEALTYSRNAIAIDPTNYYNYISEARVSELALSLQVKNAYENVKNAYQSALNYNPYNPSLYLSLARIEVSQKKYDEAQKYIGTALQLKPNYTEAIFLLSQIQVTNGQIKDAITSVQFAIQTNPQNSLLYFQLGLLQYNDKNYQAAVDALQNAIKINDQYANARYFLGLAYARLGKNADAIIQFENLASTNPDNQEVITILANLKAGRSPFNDVQPPADAKPEKRSTLPVKEKR